MISNEKPISIIWASLSTRGDLDYHDLDSQNLDSSEIRPFLAKCSHAQKTTRKVGIKSVTDAPNRPIS